MILEGNFIPGERYAFLCEATFTTADLIYRGKVMKFFKSIEWNLQDEQFEVEPKYGEAYETEFTFKLTKNRDSAPLKCEFGYFNHLDSAKVVIPTADTGDLLSLS